MINCGEYEYIEIVCLYRYPIEITMKSGKLVTGKALDTKRNTFKQECIEIQIEQDKALVVLDDILKLKVGVNSPADLTPQ